VGEFKSCLRTGTSIFLKVRSCESDTPFLEPLVTLLLKVDSEVRFIFVIFSKHLNNLLDIFDDLWGDLR
jgi:hypothetical protein